MDATHAPLQPAVRDRLTKLLGMTGSDHDGEVLNAIRLANRVLTDAKITWREALGTTAEAVPQEDFPEDWRAQAWLCAAHGAGKLTEWELRFCRSLAWSARCSPKQAAILRRCIKMVDAK